MAQNKKNTTPEVNEVDEAISKSQQFVEDNKKNISMIFAAIIIIVAAFWGVNKCSDSKNADAQDAIWVPQSQFDKGQYEQALEGFQSVIDEFGSTQTGNLAKAYAGICQKNLGNIDEAIELLSDFSGNDNVIAPAILSALGDCYVNQENPDYKKAADTFEKAAKAADNAQFTPLFLKKAGLANEAAGNNSAALKDYEAIKQNWAETSIAQSIDKDIERVK